MTTPRPDRILLLGADHGDYGHVTWEHPNPWVACGLSVGADPTSPSLRFKGDPEHAPNEDGLLVIDDGRHALLAVADGHFGVDTGHTLLQRALDLADPLPVDGRQLLELLQALVSLPPVETRSGSTLLMTLVDRGTGHGTGVSFGDSSLVLADADGSARLVNRHGRNFVSLSAPESLGLGVAEPFQFEARADEFVLVFTDGIDGCHYGEPETSITPARLGALVAAAGPTVRGAAEAVVGAALRGVDGHPGGQDNIALIATRGRR